MRIFLKKSFFIIIPAIFPAAGGIISSEVENTMTTKELLDIDDALGHEKYFQSRCMETASQLQDPELRTQVENFAQRHSQIFQNLYGLL